MPRPSRSRRQSRDDGRRLHASGGASMERRPRALQAGMVRADRQLQGPRRVRHDLGASRARGDPAARRQFRQRWRGHRSLCRCRRNQGEDPGSRLHAAQQDGPNEGIWGGGRTDPGHSSGHGRRGRAPSRANFLRQPQLAGLLPPGDEDAGLRALGRPRLPGARQHPHTHRRRQQCPRMRHRLRRTAATRGDQAASSALRSPAI